MQLFTRVQTAMRDPRLAAAYMRWKLTTLVKGDPKIRLPWGGTISHLRHFSEFWSTLNNIPPTAEHQYVRTALGQGGIAFDIGANVGAFSLMMASSGAPSIYAFEPLPATFNILAENTKS